MGLGIGIGIGAAKARGLSSGDSFILFRYSAGYSLSGATFSRTSAATYRDSGGILQTVGSGVARDNHYVLDPISGLYKRSLRMEGQRTNLVLHSQNLGDAGWTKSAATIAIGVTAPDGTATGNTITASAGSTAHSVFRQNGSATTVQTNQVRAKAGTASWMGLAFDANTTTDGAFFNLATGAVGTVAAGATATISGPDANGYYFCTVTRTYASANHYFTIEPHTADNQVAGWAAAGTETIIVWGTQSEGAVFHSFYIPTTTAAVTRAADSLSFPFTHPPQEMTVFGRFVEGGTILTGSSRIFQISQTDPTFAVYQSPPYTFYWNTQAQSLVAGPTIGNGVELRVGLFGNGTRQFWQSINGAAETTVGPTAGTALPGAFGTQSIGINNTPSGLTPGFSNFRDIIIAKGIRDMAFFRSRISP